MTCPSCGAEAPAAARFCPSCGHALAAHTDERRVATVLFADLVGFTGMSETADPETVKNLVDRCFARLASDIVAFGGRVDKVMGDAIVALFGAPIAHEDDAERAVRTALQMQTTLCEMAEERGVPVRMRIGVNTGEVLVGRLQAGDDYTAMGDVVNTAARLQESAEPGDVLVGAATRDATRGVIRYEAAGPIHARNREAPVEAWRAVESMARPGSRVRARRAPLVGRDRELGVLESLLHGAIAGRRAALVVLSGEAGLGKSRLAEELSERAAACDAFVLDGHCVPYGEANAWWPIAEALHQALGIEPQDPMDRAEAKTRALVDGLVDPSEVDRTVSALLHVMGHEEALAGVEPARARDEVALALQAALTGVSRERPVVVVLSDVHWADERVLDLVARLARRMAHCPIVTVLTTRPGLSDRWAPAPGRHNLLHLNLDPLDGEALAELVAELAPGVPERLRTTLLERSGGNPFFLEELVALVGDGTKTPSELPATLRGLVSARIDQLPASARRVLEDAAVVGRTGSLEVLAGLGAQRGEGEGEASVRTLVDADLLEVRGAEYEFRTDLVREVAYSTLSKAERARRHAAVASLIDDRAQKARRTDEQLEPLAHHYGTAARLAAEVGDVPGVPDDLLHTALHALERAAVRAEARDEPLSVIRLVDLVLELLPHLPDSKAQPLRWRALLARGRAHVGVHQIDEARADAAAVIGEATATGDERTVAQAEVVEGEALSRIDGAAAVAVLERATERATAVGDNRVLAAARRHLGFNLFMRGDLAQAEDSIREALDLYRGFDDRRGEAWALQHLAWTAFLRGQPDIASDRLERSAATFREVGDRGGEGWALGLLAWVRYQQGRLDEAEALAMRVRPQAIERGERWAEGILGVLLGQIQLWRGRVAEAVAHTEAAEATFREIGDRFGLLQALGGQVRGLAASGRPADAFDAVARARAVAEEEPIEPGAVGMPEHLESSLAVYLGEASRVESQLDGELGPGEQLVMAERAVTLGAAALQVGRADLALDLLERCAADATNVGLRAFLAGPLALARSAAGDVVGAEDVASTLLDEGDGTHLDRVHAASALAVTRARAGDASGADAAVSTALSIADATEDRVARVVVRLARVAVARAFDRPTDDLESDLEVHRQAAGTRAQGWELAFSLAAGADSGESLEVRA